MKEYSKKRKRDIKGVFGSGGGESNRIPERERGAVGTGACRRQTECREEGRRSTLVFMRVP